MEPFIKHLLNEEDTRQDTYRQYRDYYDGRQGVILTDRQRRYLHVPADKEFSANYMHIVVDSVVTRLSVNRFDVIGDAALTKVLNGWMRQMKINSIQNGVHTAAIRDGDSYGFCDWNRKRNVPVLIPHLAYDGRDGAHAYYSPEQIEPVVFAKRWTVEEAWSGNKLGMRRMNLYFADRVERYWANAQTGVMDWLPWSGNGLAPVEPYPFGFPLVHFTNRARGFRYGLSELEPGIPMQDALNKAIVDLLGAADASGFRVMTMIGGDPTGLSLAPGSWVYLDEKAPDEAAISYIPGEPLRPHIEVIDNFVQRIGQVTDTPLSYFQQSGQMASEGTHRQHEARMLAKVRTASVELGEQWEDIMRACIRLSNHYAGTMYNEEAEINTIWGDFDIRDAEEKAKVRAETMKIYTEALVGVEQAAIASGHTEDAAKKMAEMEYVNMEREARTNDAATSAESESADN